MRTVPGLSPTGSSNFGPVGYLRWSVTGNPILIHPDLHKGRCADVFQTAAAVPEPLKQVELPGEELIRWHRERCGKSEEAHAVMKDDLAGGRLPSGNLGANAAWWAIMILAFNLHAAMKRIVLGGEWAQKRMKAIRCKLIHVPGRVVRHARGLLIRLSGKHPSFQTLTTPAEPS